MKSGNLNFLETSEPVHECNGTDLTLSLTTADLQECEVLRYLFPQIMRQVVKITYATLVWDVSNVHSNTTDTMLHVQQGIPVYLNASKEWVKGISGLKFNFHAY